MPPTRSVLALSLRALSFGATLALAASAYAATATQPLTFSGGTGFSGTLAGNILPTKSRRPTPASRHKYAEHHRSRHPNESSGFSTFL
jgi:hypothetical protein